MIPVSLWTGLGSAEVGLALPVLSGLALERLVAAAAPTLERDPRSEVWMTRLLQMLGELMQPQPQPAPGPSPGPDAQGKPSGQKTGAPPGYKAMKGAIPSGVVAKAKSLLSQPMGTEVPFELDGRRYLARLEPHYHPPGYQSGPNGWHKGVSVYEAA